MRIGIDARFLGASQSGIAQYSENLLTALAQIDTENEYTVFTGDLRRRLKVGQNFHAHPINGRPLSIKGLTRFDLALRGQHFDLMHLHFPLSTIGNNFPTVITVHDIIPMTRSNSLESRSGAWDRVGRWMLYPMTMRRAKWIICVSHSTRDQLVEIFPDVFHKTIVTPSGVEEIYRQKTPEEAVAAIVRRLDLPEYYLLYSGPSWASKNIPTMLEAFARLRREDSRALAYSFVLDVTDERSGLREVRSVINQHDLQSSVRILTGLTPEERHVVFERASVLFHASKFEGFCFPVIRAQLSSVPVVAADAGALPEVTGEGGMLVDPDSLDDMATTLGRSLFDAPLREYLKDKGRKNAARFSWRDTALRVKQIYDLLF